MLLLARAHAASGDLTKALSLVEEVLKANDRDAAAHLLKGQLLVLEGKREDGFAEIRTATTIDPLSADAQFALGKMYSERGDIAAARTAFREALRINPRAAVAQVELSALEARSKPLDAVRTAEEATRTDPTSLAARLALVRSLVTARDLTRAEREMSKLRVEYPNVAAVHALDSRLALLKNDVTGARRALDRAEKLEPRSIETLSVSNCAGPQGEQRDRGQGSPRGTAEGRAEFSTTAAGSQHVRGAERSDGGGKTMQGGDSRRPLHGTSRTPCSDPFT